MKIVVTGSIAYDYIMSFPGQFKEMLMQENLDKLSISFLVEQMTRHFGGVASNICYTMALLEERPMLLGSVGHDFGPYASHLGEAGVDLSYVKVHSDLFTSSFFVNTDRSNNQIASFYSGAMQRARELGIAETVGSADLVVVAPNDPVAMQNYVRECKRLGIPYLYDPSQQVAWFDEITLVEGIDGASMLVCNEYEFAVISKKTHLSLNDIKAMVDTLVITRGQDGATIFSDGATYSIPIVIPSLSLDPTGLGDAFRGGLLKGIACGLDWAIAGRLGALAATYVLENPGPQDHRFTLEEFILRYRTTFDDGGQLDRLLAGRTTDGAR